MSWAAIASVVVGTAASVGVAAASKPELVNPERSSRKAVLASLKAYPAQRRVDMAARLGQKVEYEAGKTEDIYERQSMSLSDALAGGHITKREYDKAVKGTQAGKGRQAQGGRSPDSMIDVQVLTGTRQRTRTADFTGMGDADVQGKLARASAETMLELQKKYGPQFIAEALKQQEMADPEGVAARRLLASEITRMEKERKTRERPVATGLESQLLGEMNGGKVGAAGAAGIEGVLRDRGDTTIGAGDILGELETGPAGEARKNDQLRKMTAFLSSGASPEDAAYREKQNSLAAMSSFLGGRTPQSQFNSLSSAQTGAAPQVQGAPLVGQNPNAQQLGQAAGAQGYASGVRAAANNVSPWFSGLSLLTQGASVAGQAGWQPMKAA